MSAILHVDMDAFYASVEERDRPELRGKPVVVGGNPDGRGVVAAANYVARTFGIHSAMPAAAARRRCPDLIFLRSRMDHYAQVSQQIRAIFHRYTPLVEPLSLDEAFLDVTASARLFGTATDIGRRIQDEISRELALSASVGVAPTKFVAKVASDLRKPKGFVVVDPDQVQAFLDPLPVERLWGVGKVGARALAQLHVRTIADLRQLPRPVLQARFGKWGEHIRRLAHGIDERAVVPDQQAKSISHETTFDTEIQELEVLRAWLLELTTQVAARLRRHDLRGRTVHIKIRFPDFRTITRARSLTVPSNITRELWEVAAQLLTANLPARNPGVRLLGMGVSDLGTDTPTQGDLLQEDVRCKQRRIDAVADEVKERFGADALKRALELPRTEKP